VRLFVRPVCWLNPMNHESECFFCNTSLIGTSAHNRENLHRYHFKSDTVNASAMPPLPFTIEPTPEFLPLPTATVSNLETDFEYESDNEFDNHSDPDYQGPTNEEE